ncbi:MAG: phosphoribosylglycinamide formyltransferase [Acutalibacteraceae bacterium]|jgi:phosphoribosylglycinamide formyltransferase-1
MLNSQNKIRVAVLVSGGGTNLQALIDSQNKGDLGRGEICCVISSNPNAFALERAKNAGIKAVTVDRKKYSSAHSFDEAILNALLECSAEMVVLAGFLSILGPSVIERFKDKIINVHPSLIPSFCGHGFYGLKVHEEALKRGVKITGATVHLVNEIPDAGRILLQKPVEVSPEDTPETLQKKVMELAEWKILPQAVALLSESIYEEKKKGEKI